MGFPPFPGRGLRRAAGMQQLRIRGLGKLGLLTAFRCSPTGGRSWWLRASRAFPRVRYTYWKEESGGIKRGSDDCFLGQ